MAGLVFVLCLPVPGLAQEKYEPTQEIWAGADVTSSSWAAYSGLTAALLGPLSADGWRVRAVGGYGGYSYDGPFGKVDGTFAFYDVLVGYHVQWGALTVKAFAGVASEDHTLLDFDPENTVVGSDLGGKALVETWWEIDAARWASLDLSYSTVHGGRYAARGRFGYRVMENLSLGIEAAAMGGGKLGDGRVGAFARYAWSSGEISLASGLSDRVDRDPGAYGTVNVLYKY